MKYSDKTMNLFGQKFLMRLSMKQSRYFIYELTLIYLVCLSCTLVRGAHVKKAVMLAMDGMDPVNCQSRTIVEKNSSSTVILTGTIKTCDKLHPTAYSCQVQVWRVMKGKKLVEDLSEVVKEDLMSSIFIKTYLTISGLGNRAFCDSQVKTDNTRIFFLNRVDDKLVLATSLLHITLKNLENTQEVIKGVKVKELPKKHKDPCFYALCAFGATCEASENGTATCVCPPVTCRESDSSDTFAPICGSDGVTYTSECRLNAQRCWTQRRIQIVSRRPCTPVIENDRCKKIKCGNMAECVVEQGSAKCQCPDCRNDKPNPVCASDQKSYRSRCDVRRTACLEARELRVVRRAPCNPCEVYNAEKKTFDIKCDGSCALNESHVPQCCDTLPCQETENTGLICGSNGRTYISTCAMKRYACKTGNVITQVANESCPTPKDTTIVRGSASIAADGNCPGNCNESSMEFVKFKSDLERLVNKNLNKKNVADIDARMLTGFTIDEVRPGSLILVYSVSMTWADHPIGEDSIPGMDSLWVFERLHDPARGVLKLAINKMKVTYVSYKNPVDDFLIEDVCGPLQCQHGAGCSVSLDSRGEFRYACECSALGDARRLPVTMACKVANNNRTYDNHLAARRSSCYSQAFLTFKDTCDEPPGNPCANTTCPVKGSSCILTDGVPTCECITCSEEFDPVCGSDKRTYKSMCHLERENCLHRTSITMKSKGMCGSQCDEVDCQNGSQCEELAQSTALCSCPTKCLEVYAPVCGSDGKTYDNECDLTLAACKMKSNIRVVQQHACDDSKLPEEVGSGEMEGSGEAEADVCGCRFGAVCDDTTIDDEDSKCVCLLKCTKIYGPPICGSDRKTYNSECELKTAQCKEQKRITIASKGPCVEHCASTKYGCCNDGVTAARGREMAGCPELCNCNPYGSFSITCDPTSGQCVCRPGVGGVKCDRCQPGFWNFHSVVKKRTVGCMNCRCYVGGSVRDDCDQMTGQCTCIEGVTGVKCSKCVSTDKWVTSFGCDADGSSQPPQSKSCDDHECRYGQECVTTGPDSAMCQCPPISSCSGYSSDGKICGSDGITYADECHMKVVACRQSVVITVIADGLCEDYIKEMGPVIPPLIKPTTTERPIVTTATTPTTTTLEAVVSTTAETLPVRTEETESEEGSGSEFTTTFQTTIDDEDGDMESSGDEGVLDKNTAGKMVSDPMVLAATAVINTPNSFPPGFQMNDPEFLAESSAMMKAQISQILKFQKPLGGVSIKSLDVVKMDNDGITMKIVFSVPSEEVKSAVRQSLSNLPGQSWIFEEPGNVRQQALDFMKIPTENTVYAKAMASKSLEKFLLDEPDVKPDTSLYREGGDWDVPQLGGTSYLEFKKMSAYSAVTIHMRFKTSDPEGLLLYSGQKEGRDFISLSIIGGFVEFRFDTGSGQLSLRSTVPVYDGKWHDVISRRNRREGMLMVDNEQEISGNSQSGTTGLNLDTSLYIGGVTNSLQDKVQKQTGVQKGLTGCISMVKVGEHGHTELPIKSGHEDIIHSFRLSNCSTSPCLPSPCKNSANCFITRQLEEFTYKCECNSLYSGQNCENKKTTAPCSPNPCHETAVCIETEDYFSCVCPPTRTGFHCNEFLADLKLPTVLEPSYMPVFAGDSFIQRPSLSDVGSRLDVEIAFYTFETDGLLFYNAQSNTGKGDFVALLFRNGFLEFMYNLGQGTVVIKSPMRVNLNEWHLAKLSRLGKLGDLTLDDGLTIKGEAPRDHSQLNLEQPLYIGAVPEGVTVPEIANVGSGLMGSIQKFVVNGVVFPRSLMSDNSTSYNVRAFNGHPCYRKPCQNEGTCIPNLGEFECVCKSGFSGDLCDTDEHPLVVPMLQDSVEQAIYFNGKVQAMYNNHITQRDNSFKDNYVELQLRTTQNHGLIFYDGKASKRGDYIAFAVSYGRLHLTFDLGSGPAHIVSDEIINDGQWRSVQIIRNEHKASLQVDFGYPKHVSAPHLTKWLNTDGILWIGGCEAERMPPRHRGLPRSFYTGFKGCLQNVLIDGTLLYLRADALNNPDLLMCSGR